MENGIECYAFGSEYDELDFDSQVARFFGESDQKMRIFAANTLIDSRNTSRVSDHVGQELRLVGFYAKNVTFKNGNSGKITLVFGYADSSPVAYSTTSDRFFDALMKIALVFGKDFGSSQINVRILQNQTENGGASYSLEVIE